MWRDDVAQHAGALPCYRAFALTLLKRTTGKTPNEKFLLWRVVEQARARLAESYGAILSSSMLEDCSAASLSL
jgi:hypothetical protein